MKINIYNSFGGKKNYTEPCLVESERQPDATMLTPDR